MVLKSAASLADMDQCRGGPLKPRTVAHTSSYVLEHGHLQLTLPTQLSPGPFSVLHLTLFPSSDGPVLVAAVLCLPLPLT